MYKNLGIHWASSIPAFLALACAPFPFLLYKYGHLIRAKCKYSAEAQVLMQQLQSRSQQPTKQGKTPTVENLDLSEQQDAELDDGDIEKQLESDSKSKD